MTIAVVWKPEWKVHPSWIIFETMQERGLTVQRLAEVTGWTAAGAYDVLHRRVPVSPAVADAWGPALGLSPALLLRLQELYDEGDDERSVRARLADEALWREDHPE